MVPRENCLRLAIRDLSIEGRGSLRALHTELAHKVWRQTFFKVRVLRKENLNSLSFSTSDLKVRIVINHTDLPLKFHLLPKAGFH